MRRRSPQRFAFGGPDAADRRRPPGFDISSDDGIYVEGPAGSGLTTAERQQVPGYYDIAPQAVVDDEGMQEQDDAHSSTSSFDIDAEIAAVQREREERKVRQADADLGPLPPERAERSPTPVGQLMRTA